MLEYGAIAGKCVPSLLDGAEFGSVGTMNKCNLALYKANTPHLDRHAITNVNFFVLTYESRIW